MPDEIIDEFDEKVASVWILIALGAGKTVEELLKLLAAHGVAVHAGGADVTMVALYASLTTAATTGLIAWRTIGN